MLFFSFVHYPSVCQSEGQIQNHQRFEQLKVLINREIPGPHLHLLSSILWEHILRNLFKQQKCENQESKHTVELLFSKQTLNTISYIWSLFPLSVQPGQMGALSSMYYDCLKVGAWYSFFRGIPFHQQ